MRSSFRATISEALNAAQRYADCIGVVAMGSVGHTGKTSFYAVNVAGRLDKPVFVRLSHFDSPPSLLHRSLASHRGVASHAGH
jgi:hypothetical protein